MTINKYKNTILHITIGIWMLLCLYTWGVIIYCNNSQYQKLLSKVLLPVHELNVKYYKLIYPLIYQKYIWANQD
jgi:hypothetical protein